MRRDTIFGLMLLSLAGCKQGPLTTDNLFGNRTTVPAPGTAAATAPYDPFASAPPSIAVPSITTPSVIAPQATAPQVTAPPAIGNNYLPPGGFAPSASSAPATPGYTSSITGGAVTTPPTIAPTYNPGGNDQPQAGLFQWRRWRIFGGEGVLNPPGYAPPVTRYPTQPVNYSSPAAAPVANSVGYTYPATPPLVAFDPQRANEAAQRAIAENQGWRANSSLPSTARAAEVASPSTLDRRGASASDVDPAPTADHGSESPNVDNSTAPYMVRRGAAPDEEVRFAGGDVASPTRGEVHLASGEARIDDPVDLSDRVYRRDAQFRWVQGRLEYDRAAREWSIRYAANGENDPYDGVLPLDGGAALDGFQDGDFVAIQGTLIDDRADEQPWYEVGRIRPL